MSDADEARVTTTCLAILPHAGIDFKIRTIELGDKKIKLQIWYAPRRPINYRTLGAPLDLRGPWRDGRCHAYVREVATMEPVPVAIQAVEWGITGRSNATVLYGERHLVLAGLRRGVSSFC